MKSIHLNLHTAALIGNVQIRVLGYVLIILLLSVFSHVCQIHGECKALVKEVVDSTQTNLILIAFEGEAKSSKIED